MAQIHTLSQKFLHLVCSIRFRLVLFAVVLSVFPLLALSTYLVNSAGQVILAEATAYQQTSLSYMTDYLDRLLSEADDIATAMIVNRTLSRTLAVDVSSLSTYEQYRNIQQVRTEIVRYRDAGASIHSIYLMDLKNGRLFSTETAGYVPQESLEQTGWDRQVEDFLQEQNTWELFTAPQSFLTQGAAGVPLLSHRRHVQSDGADFVLFLNISQSAIETALRSLLHADNMWVLVTDSGGSPLCSLAPAGAQPLDAAETAALMQEADSRLIQIGATEYSCVSTLSRNGEWRLYALQPKEDLMAPLDTVRRSTLLVEGVLLGFFVLFGIFIYRSFYRPVCSLLATMRQNREGGPAYSPLERRRDEFGRVGRHFNRMIRQISELNQRVLRQEILAKNARIKLLRSQINPHFLYNVLDTIHWMARMGRTDDVSRITFALSRYYRQSLNEGRDMVPLQKAVELMNSYWEIIEIRCPDKYSLITDIEPSLLDCVVPLQLLQPLIENAVQHGFNGCSRAGVVLVTGTDRGRDMCIQVEDNGVGMERPVLDRLNSQLATPTDLAEGNFALRNLNGQVRAAFGPDYGITVNSDPGSGTTVTILLPKTTGHSPMEGESCTRF